MKKLFLAALLAVPCLTLEAKANWFPLKIEAGGNFYLHVLPKGHSIGHQLGPWYQYWPLEAHFQQPAPGAHPPYAGPQSLPYGFGAGAMGHPAPSYGGGYEVPKTDAPKKKTSRNTSIYKPVNWSPIAPAYWYPR